MMEQSRRPSTSRAIGQVLHGCATTTQAVWRAIRHSQASVRALAARYGVNPKTVVKWKRRGGTADARMGPKTSASTVLTPDEEAVVVAFRRHTLLPLDDCLYAPQATAPNLTRSSLHRCLQRHGISRLPDVDGDKPARKKFKAHPIGFFHVDIAEVLTAEGRPYLFVATDRTGKFAFARLIARATMRAARDFLEELVRAVPHKIHTVLTDNGVQFASLPKNRNGVTAVAMGHPFDRVCRLHGIEHRLTKPNHPWTNGQVERMNRTIKQAIVRRYHYDSHDQLRRHPETFLAAYNFAKRLKTLRGLTSHEFIYRTWLEDPVRFRSDPNQYMLGLYI